METKSVSGQATNYKIHGEKHTNYGPTLISIIEQIPNLWIVAQKDNIKYKSRLILPVSIKVKVMNKDIKPKIIKDQESAPSGRLLKPLRYKFNQGGKRTLSGSGTFEFRSR